MRLQAGVLAGLASAAITMAAQVTLAQDRSFSREQMAAVVRENMPDVLKNDLPGLVDTLLNVPLGKPLQETFDPNQAAAIVFGRLPRSVAPDCLRRGTPVGEPDQGDCVISNGQEGGAGGYIALSYGKNVGTGNLKFLKRPAVRDLDPRALTSVKLPNDQAYDIAMQFLQKVFGMDQPGLPPKPPAGVALPVRELTVGFDKQAGLAPIVMQKTVHLQRAFALPKAIPSPRGELTHVLGPGKAMVALDDSGIVGAAVAGWEDLRRDPNLSSANAKTSAELIEEIADDLFAEGNGPIASMNFQIMLASDWRGTFGLLLPAVRVFVAPVARDPTEEEQQRMARQTTAGVVRDYLLVNRSEADLEKR